MAWATPFTWTTGDDLTAARLNQDLRDNPLFLFNAPCARVFNSAALSIANATSVALTFNGELFDTGTLHSTVSNTGRIQAGVAGKYLLGFHLNFAGNLTGIRIGQLRLNGTTVIAASYTPPPTTADEPSVTATTLYALGVGDYVEVLAYQASGGAINVTRQTNFSPEFWGAWQAA